MKIIIDGFLNGAKEIDHPYSDWTDDDLAFASLNGDKQAEEELDKRVHKEVMESMKKDGYTEQELNEAVSKAVLPDLVKARRAMMDHALARLKEMPDDDGLVDVPWEIIARPKIDDHHWSDSKIKAVAIEKLFATQRKLKKENIEWHIKHPGETHGGKNAFPNIVKNIDGNRLIYDGHHRLAALWLLGSDDALVWYLKEQDL